VFAAPSKKNTPRSFPRWCFVLSIVIAHWPLYRIVITFCRFHRYHISSFPSATILAQSSFEQLLVVCMQLWDKETVDMDICHTLMLPKWWTSSWLNDVTSSGWLVAPYQSVPNGPIRVHAKCQLRARMPRSFEPRLWPEKSWKKKEGLMHACNMGFQLLNKNHNKK